MTHFTLYPSNLSSVILVKILMDKQKGIDEILETYNLLRLNHEEIEN